MKAVAETGELYPNQVLSEIDSALQVDNERIELTRCAEQRVRDGSLTRLSGLPRILRWIGGVVLLASAAAFILQRWNSLEWYTRYGAFFSFTAVLAFAGLFSGLKLKDDKTARTFLGIATAIVPAHFAQLGAYLYSFVPGSARNIPEIFLYRADSPLVLYGLIGVAIIALTPIVYMGFSTMARADAICLTLTYVLLNITLLVPVREANLIAGIGLVVFSVLSYLDYYRFSRHAKLKTFEGYAVRAMLYVPFVLLLARNLYLYQISSIFAALILFVAGIGCFVVLARIRELQRLSGLLQGVGTFLFSCSWIEFANGLFLEPPRGLIYLLFGPDVSNFVLPIMFLPIAVLIAMLSFFVKHGEYGYRRLAAAIILVTVVLELAIFPGVGSSVLCLIAGIIAVITGYMMEEKGLFRSGMLGVAFGVLYQLRYAMTLYALSPWVSLAMVGMLTVFLASYLDRNGRALIERYQALQQRMKSWN